MDTKLKRYSIVLKIVAFVLIIASTIWSMLTLIGLKNAINDHSDISNFEANHYTETWQYQRMYYQLHSKTNTIFEYKSEEYILEGKAVSQTELNAQVQNIFDDNQYNIEQMLLNLGHTNITTQMLWDKFNEDYKTEIDKIKNDLIEEQLLKFRDALTFIENTEGLHFYIKIGENIFSNKNYESIINSKYSQAQTNYETDRKTVISQAVLAFDEDYINDLNNKFITAKHDATVLIIQGSAGLLVFLLALAYLIFAAGKKAASPKGIHHVFVDRLYNEITAVLLLLSGFAAAACAMVIIRESFNIIFMFVLLVCSVLLAVSFTLMLVRHIKSRTLFKHTIIFTVFRFIFKVIKKSFDAGPTMVKALILVTALGLLTAIPFMFFVTLPFAIIFTYIQVTKYIAIKNGVKRLKDGVYNQKLDIVGNGELAILAADINSISSGLGIEVERRMKSERLKTELIVNVSHDIRTPLTSVITYVDLLSKENIESENAKKYIDIIAVKSNRLKTLIDDLFDASKAASGNINVNFEKVDINALITQGFGELDEQIKASSLDFKINMPDKKIIAYGDGKLTWRVLENLLSNAIKYSLANSRVYIDVSEDERNVYIEIKNISATELNIPEDEIMERFKRGDESRGSEGSGLGLDIAKSLMACQNGELTIKIDGDLFKVKLSLPKHG